MEQLTHPSTIPGQPMPAVREVPWTRPLDWLRRGGHDLRRLGGRSAVYGLAVAVAGAVLLALGWGAAYLVPAFVGGFLLVAPFFAVGVYALSRQLEAGKAVDMKASFIAWRVNTGQLALFGLVLVLLMFLWERLAAIIFALFFGASSPELARVAGDMRGAAVFLPVVITFMLTGAALAMVVFALSVVSAPLLLDRSVDAVTAVLTSMQCCLRNPGAMALWAVLLAGIMVVGFATALIGMIVLFPWLAHASWHAYRDLVE